MTVEDYIKTMSIDEIEVLENKLKEIKADLKAKEAAANNCESSPNDN